MAPIRLPAWRILYSGTSGFLVTLFLCLGASALWDLHLTASAAAHPWTDWGTGALLPLSLYAMGFPCLDIELRRAGHPVRPLVWCWAVGAFLGVLAALAVLLSSPWTHPRLLDSKAAVFGLALLLPWVWIAVILVVRALRLTDFVPSALRRRWQNEVAVWRGWWRGSGKRADPEGWRRTGADRRTTVGVVTLGVIAGALGPLFFYYSRHGAGWGGLPPLMFEIFLLIAFFSVFFALCCLFVRSRYLGPGHKVFLVACGVALAPGTLGLAKLVDLGSPVRVDWEVAAAPGATADPVLAAWSGDEQLVRAGESGLSAYRHTDGSVAWEWTPQDGTWVCSVAEGPADDPLPPVVLLALRTTVGGPCETVTALDSATGAELWSGAFEGGGALSPGQLALAGSEPVAVLAEGESGLRAVGAGGGEPLWQADPGEDCFTVHVAGDATALVSTELCLAENGPVPRATVRDPETGTPRSSHQLPPAAEVDVLSIDPLVVRAGRAVVSFAADPEGVVIEAGGARLYQPTPEIPSIASQRNATGIERPALDGPASARSAVVVGDVLVTRGAVVRETISAAQRTRTSATTHVVAYSLTDGGVVWESDTFAGQVSGMALGEAGVTVASEQQSGNSTVLRTFDPATGDQRAASRIKPDVSGIGLRLNEAPEGGWLITFPAREDGGGPLAMRVR